MQPWTHHWKQVAKQRQSIKMEICQATAQFLQDLSSVIVAQVPGTLAPRCDLCQQYSAGPIADSIWASF